MPTFHLLNNKKLLVGVGGFYSFMTSIKIHEDRTDNATGITTFIDHNGGNTSYMRGQKDYGMSGYAGYIINLSKKTDLENAYSTWQRNNVILFSTLSPTVGRAKFYLYSRYGIATD